MLTLLISLVVLINLIFAVKSILYRKTYKRASLKYDTSWTPICSVFVPCKGLEDGMENYLRAMLTQDYPSYRVYFITESQVDPAFSLVSKLTEEYSFSSVVTAGRADKCCQKNHNLLAGINIDLKREDKAEIFVFADADVKPSDRWLRDLILPMSSQNISATTAYRWLKPAKFSFWGTMHAMLSAYLGTLMSSSKGMWGGSMAVKVSDFVKYGVKERWERAVGDDIPLMEIILKEKLDRIFVPICTAESQNVIDKFSSLFAWFVRQNQYLKIYCHGLWIIACLLTILNFFSVLFSIFIVIAAPFIPSISSLFFPFLFYLISMALVMALSRFEGKEGQSYFLWVLMAYPSMFMGFLTLMASGIQKDMIWRGIRYGINKDGTVSFVKVEKENG